MSDEMLTHSHRQMFHLTSNVQAP